MGQRAPRVRFGQVDVYNNHYVISRDQTVGYGYSIGVGFDSHLHVEANAFTTGGVVDAGQLLSVLKGSEVLTRDNLVDHRRVDLRAACNEGRPAQEQLAEDTSWEPTLRRCVDRVQHVDGVVGAWAGPRFGPAPGRIGEDCRA